MTISKDSGTWHHGLVARWWAEFNVAEPQELHYFRSAIKTSGEPVLDVACGTGRLLLPLLAEGFDVDGVDISADMIANAKALAAKQGLTPTLTIQAMHELDLPRRYRTIYICGSFGIGGRRDHDREGLRRIFRHLEDGGVLLINHQLPYEGYLRQGGLTGRLAIGGGIPQQWPREGSRRRTANGDEIELIARIEQLDPLEQTQTLAMRARLWRGAQIVHEESHALKECLYFAQEVLFMLQEVGFRDLAIEGNYTGRPATGDDGTVVFVAKK